MFAECNKSFYRILLQKLEPGGPRETKGVLSMSENKYTFTHAARISTVRDGEIRTTGIGTYADNTPPLSLSPSSLA